MSTFVQIIATANIKTHFLRNFKVHKSPPVYPVPSQ